MGGGEALDHRLVLRLQDAAGRVHQPAPRLHQARGRAQDAELLLRQLDDRVGTVAPLEIRVAAQRAEAAARRIDQNPVELAREPLGAHVALARERERVNVRDPRARRARRERVQPLGRYVHRVQTARAAHEHRQRQRLAARAGAEVGHHLASPRRHQVGEQLAALVLHFDQTLLEQRVAVDRRLAREPDPSRRVRRRRAVDAARGERRERALPIGAREVDAQIERRRVQQPLRDAHRLRRPLLRLEALPQPVRQVGSHRGGPGRFLRRARARDELAASPARSTPSSARADKPCTRDSAASSSARGAALAAAASSERLRRSTA